MLATKRIPYPEKPHKSPKHEFKPKTVKKLQCASSLSPVCPIRIVKTVKSQHEVRVKLHKQLPQTEPKASVMPILIKSVEKRTALLNDSKEPSPIVSSTKSHFYSITDEETKEMLQLLRQLKK